MLTSVTVLLALAASIASAGPISIAGSTWLTPHEQYSSSIGVLGCKIDTNRVAYWPGVPDCDNICIKVSHGSRHIFLLRIDSSQGAYDISYDAWNYLYTGKNATVAPVYGSGVSMDFQYVHTSHCKHLMEDGMLAFSAPNSMNYISTCITSHPDSWVANNHVLYNILDPICKWGVDERCTVDFAVSNQPSCPSGLGSTTALNLPVMNIAYGTGKVYQAT